jgi:hypothetical protein
MNELQEVRMMLRNWLAIPAAVFLVSASTLAHAALSHTWVAYYGNDSNSGTVSSPYADFQTAANNTAAGGIVSVLTPGDFGAVSITQSITIDGTGGGSIGFTGSEGIYINAPTSATVVIRNLTIDGEGEGIDAIFFEQGMNLVVDGCRMEGFSDIGVGVGSTTTMNVVIRDTTIVGGELGVRTFQSDGEVPYDHVSLQNVTIQGASTAGVFTRNGSVAITDSMISENYVGLEADTSAVLTAERTMLYYNQSGVCVYNPGTIRLSNTDILGNVTGIANCGGTVASAGDNPVAGNPTTYAPTGTVTLQ